MREAFRAVTSPSILAWGVAKAGIYSVTSAHSLLIRHSNSVYCVKARMHATCALDASAAFSTIFCSVVLSRCCTQQSLCWISSKRDVWRTYNGSCGSQAKSRCTSMQAWNCTHKVGGLRVSVAPGRGQRWLSVVTIISMLVSGGSLA